MPMIRVDTHNYLRTNTPSTIDLDRRARNEISSIASQMYAKVSDIIRVSQSTKWHVEKKFLDVLLSGGYADKALEQRCCR